LRLVIAVIRNDTVQQLLDALTDRGLTATKLASTGGFLKQGNTTLLIGVEDHQVEETIDLFKERCSRKISILPQINPSTPFSPTLVTRPVETVQGGATIFVLNIEQCENER